MSLPTLPTQWDVERARRLRSARWRATGLLVLAAAVFVATQTLTDGTGVWGFVRAASEAAVVGGVADWFAVTALFRHPLGIPIPHTAVIVRGKDAFGRGLGEFVARNFLDPDNLTARLEEIDPAGRLANWLVRPPNAAAVARQAAGIVVGITDALSDEEVQAGIRRSVEDRIRDVDVTHLLGVFIERGMEGGHHHALIDATLLGVARSIEDNQGVLRDRIRRESPWWVPEPVDERVFQRVYDALQRFVAEVTADPNHEIRHHLDERVRGFATSLQTSPELRARGEALKSELLDHPEFQAWAEGLWADLKEQIARAAKEPESVLRVRLEGWVVTLGERLREDPSLRDRVDTWIGSVVGRVVEQSGDEVTGLIASTVERWDAEETSRRLELLLGRDLQYIRINGTLVGGLVGLLIHTVVRLSGG